MAYRSSRSDYSDRDYTPGPSRRAPTREIDEVDIYERRERRSPPRRAPVREYEDIDIQIRDRERDRVDRTPAFLKEDNRRPETGALVLRQREVESVDRRRPRSPSPIRYRERFVERDRERAPSMPPDRRPRYIERSPSPAPAAVRVESRVIERRRERSPSPDRERELIKLRIEREKEKPRSPTPSPSPPPPPPAPPVIRGPTIEREVITHYRDIDHGVIRAKPPTPPPPPRTAPPQVRERELDIDIDIRHDETDVDVRSRSRSRPVPRARSRSRPRPHPRHQPSYYDEDDLVIERDRETVRVSEGRRRAHSAAPPPRSAAASTSYDDEAEYITGKIDSRGRMGEALHGVTKDWTIVDVPPGTERVMMDGVGGGGAEVTWQRYSGVRRSKFLPDREDTPVSIPEPPPVREREREPSRDRERLSIQVYDSRDKSRDREVEVEEISDRRISIRNEDRAAPPPRKRNEMWTEITKDLVTREAIERMGYEYEETEWFFYVMQYLRYEDVLELTNLSDDIRRARRRRAQEIEWEREWDRRHRNRRSLNWDKMDDERVVEREVVYDRGTHRTYVR
ncbi:hypothetical protein GGR53DRAFT_190721 [Hypoxylon sp. FL1150]|nr:hypothetical protein GGR53DRAFT_190721 [Hypoxylon sp. FL1150]